MKLTTSILDINKLPLITKVLEDTRITILCELTKTVISASSYDSEYRAENVYNNICLTDVKSIWDELNTRP